MSAERVHVAPRPSTTSLLPERQSLLIDHRFATVVYYAPEPLELLVHSLPAPKLISMATAYYEFYRGSS